MGMVRLDKILAQQSLLSRKDIKNLVKQGAVEVNGVQIWDADRKVDIDKDEVFVNKQKIHLKEYTYIMMNKPQGVVSATQDPHTPTVVDILPPQLQRKGLFPAGRLDKDTVGLMLITNDGMFAHNILSPKKHVEKTYLAELDREISQDLIQEFERGVYIGNGDMCMPATLKILHNQEKAMVEVKIKQGMYHQIKRMFSAYGYQVVFLKRTQMGDLCLDPTLSEGESRELTEEEVASLYSMEKEKMAPQPEDKNDFETNGK